MTKKEKQETLSHNTTLPQPVKKRKKKKKYLNNADILKQVVLSKEAGKMTDELAKMLIMITYNFSKQSQFAGYTYVDDMKAYAQMMLVYTWHKFREDKSQNPFSFYTQCVKNSFIQYLNHEKRQRLIRDKILVNQGLTPSFNYQLDYEHEQHTEDEEDHHQHIKEAELLKEETDTDPFFSV